MLRFILLRKLSFALASATFLSFHISCSDNRAWLNYRSSSDEVKKDLAQNEEESLASDEAQSFAEGADSELDGAIETASTFSNPAVTVPKVRPLTFNESEQFYAPLSEFQELPKKRTSPRMKDTVSALQTSETGEVSSKEPTRKEAPPLVKRDRGEEKEKTSASENENSTKVDPIVDEPSTSALNQIDRSLKMSSENFPQCKEEIEKIRSYRNSVDHFAVAARGHAFPLYDLDEKHTPYKLNCGLKLNKSYRPKVAEKLQISESMLDRNLAKFQLDAVLTSEEAFVPEYIELSWNEAALMSRIVQDMVQINFDFIYKLPRLTVAESEKVLSNQFSNKAKECLLATSMGTGFDLELHHLISSSKTSDKHQPLLKSSDHFFRNLQYEFILRTQAKELTNKHHLKILGIENLYRKLKETDRTLTSALPLYVNSSNLAAGGDEMIQNLNVLTIIDDLRRRDKYWMLKKDYGDSLRAFIDEVLAYEKKRSSEWSRIRVEERLREEEIILPNYGAASFSNLLRTGEHQDKRDAPVLNWVLPNMDTGRAVNTVSFDINCDLRKRFDSAPTL